MQQAVDQRPVKGLTVWQAWRRLKKDRYAPATVERTDKSIRAWEKYTTDPAVGIISATTFALFREKALAGGLSAVTVDVHAKCVAAIIRQFRPLELQLHKNVVEAEGALLTAREAFAKYYLPASPAMAKATIRKFRHDFNFWERFTPNRAVPQITTADFEEVRTKALAANLSHVTIERILSDVLTVLVHLKRTKILADVPWVGKRLKLRPRLKPTPTLADVAQLYAATHAVRWPARRFQRPTGHIDWSPRSGAVEWWRCLLVLLYFSALRRADALTLRWEEIEDGWIRRTMKKTGFTVEIPIHPVLQQHLDALPKRKRGPYVLGYVGSHKQIAKERSNLSSVAGVRLWTFQGIRRLSAQQFEKARAGAGGLVLGHQYRTVDKFYLDPVAALVEALPNLAVPEGMGPQPSKPAPKVNALDVLRGLSREELIEALGELLSDRAPA
jgi:integrase